MKPSRTALLISFVGLASALAAGAACFPDYGFDTPTSADAGIDGTTLVDGNVRVDAPTQDGSGDATAVDGGGMDARPGPDAANFDATGLAVGNAGAFYFQVMVGSNLTLIDAQATFSHPFAIDTTEVTVGQFEAWVNAKMPLPCDGGTGCVLDRLTDGGPGPYASMTWDANWNASALDTSFENGGGNKCSLVDPPAIRTFSTGRTNLPVNCVQWAQALAFCAWEGKRLPTDTEWRYFATGGGTTFPFPWGATAPDCPYAIASYDAAACGFPVPVGTAAMGRSKHGAFDLVGDLSEWGWDPTPGNLYSYPPDAGTDYAGPPAGANNGRIYLGGSYSVSTPEYLESVYLGGLGNTTSGYDDNGFRCARTLP